MNIQQQACGKVASAAKILARKYRGHLEKLKANGKKKFSRSDFLWYLLMQSFSTWGSSRGFELMKHYDEVAFTRLKCIPSAPRKEYLRKVLRKYHVRYHKNKARFIAGCLNQIEEGGGLYATQKTFQNLSDRTKIIEFLDVFPGIGPKYARNIPMDLYHPCFRDAIALDTSIKRVTKIIGLHFRDYDEHEQFYIEAAHKVGLEGWELDRLIYHYQDELVALLSQK